MMIKKNRKIKFCPYCSSSEVVIKWREDENGLENYDKDKDIYTCYSCGGFFHVEEKKWDDEI